MSPYRIDETDIEFHNDFIFWLVVASFRGEYTCDFLCNGWEL